MAPNIPAIKPGNQISKINLAGKQQFVIRNLHRQQSCLCNVDINLALVFD